MLRTVATKHEALDPGILRESLLRRREQLGAAIQREPRGLCEQADASSEHVGELADRLALTPAAEIGYELIGARTDLLRQIEEVLRKLDGGTYGICEHCDNSIPTARLRAIPSAVRCTLCQEAWERTAHARVPGAGRLTVYRDPPPRA